MPGNELGDRVHNFFAQDNASQGHHQSHDLEGNWSVPNSHYWVGSPRPVDVLNSSKNFSGQNSAEIDRVQSSHPVHSAHGLNFSQSNLRPDFSRSQPLNEHQYSNGYTYGNQLSQSRQNEANFREPDTYSDQRHLLVSRGFPVHEFQRISSHEQQPKASERSATSVAPVSFDLFGGQQQVNHQQANMLQALQRQQSGLSDIQQLQQQIMFRKMEELQRQQQLQQLDLRPQNSMYQVHPAMKQSSGSQSSPFNGSPNSDVLRNPWTSETGTNWLGCGSSAMPGSSSGIDFLPNLGQAHRFMDVANQQVDESLYGVPVSSSRGLAVNQQSPMMTDRSSLSQMQTSANSLHSNQLNFMPHRHTGQEGTSISRQNFQNDTKDNASVQSLNTDIMELGFHQQVNSLQNNATQQDHVGRQELATLSEASHDRFTMQVSSPQNENTLDPDEEKILYGSDDNIWSAFGKLPSESGEAGNLFESSGKSNGFLSIQSGSWSALMQSAVAENSSTDIGAQGERSGLNFHRNDCSSENQPTLIHNENVKQASFPNDGIRTPSALGSESVRSSNVNTLSPMRLNQIGHTFQRNSSDIVPTDVSQRFGQSLAGASKWLNHKHAQTSLVDENDMHGNTSENAIVAENNGKAISVDWPPGQSGLRPQPNGWNALAAVPPGGDGALNIHNAEKVSRNSQNNQRVMQGQGEMIDGGSLWRNSLSTATEFGTVRSTTGTHQPHKSKGDLSLHNATSSVANSCNMAAGDGVDPFAQKNYLLNQWKHVCHSTKLQGGEGLGRTMDHVHDQNQGLWKSSAKDESINFRENCAMKDTSNDSRCSNLSGHASGGFRESGTVDAIDSRALPSGKQKSINQLAKKGSATRKFQYHPMGNLDDDTGSTHGTKQPTLAHAMSLQNAQFGQLKLFGQVPRNSTEKVGLPKDSIHIDQEPSGASFPGYAPGTSNLFSRSFDSSTNKASPPSQNMLELLHKVDQSRDNDSLMHLSSSSRNVSSQRPEAENSDESAGHLQRSLSSLSQGFGLQLGPPSQLLQKPDLSPPSQIAQSMINATHTTYAGTVVGEKSMLIASSLQSSQLPNGKTQIEHENDTAKGPRQRGNDNSVSQGNYHLAFTSDTPYARSQLQNKQITRLSARAAMNQHNDSSFSYNNSHSMERGFKEIVLPDASGDLQKTNPPSGTDAQQSGPYDVQEIGPAGSASSMDLMRGSQHLGLPGISPQGSSSQVLHNMWANVPAPQHVSVTQYPKGPSHFHEPPQPNILESSSCGDLDVSKGSHISFKSAEIHADSPVGIDGKDPRLNECSAQLASASKIEASLGSASSIKNHLDESPANSASTRKDIEDFGRSLTPNTFSNDKFSLLNQMRALKNAENDPSVRFSKRTKGLEIVHDIHQAHLLAEKQSQDPFSNALVSSSGAPPEDSREVSFSLPSDALQRNTSPQEADREDVAAVTGLQDSQSKPPADGTGVRVEHHMVSPQMAPSWFNQCGSFRNGQLLPLQNVCHAMPSRPEATPFSVGMSSSIMETPYLDDKPIASPVEAHQITGSLKSSPTVEANEHLSYPSLPVNLPTQNQMVLGPKKRKSCTSELLSWYKEISPYSQSPSILSVVEADWSKAVNRLAEKVEDCVDLIEDGPQMFKSKRRLILTTQLMQQIFCPFPTAVLSADASSGYESVAFAASRVALGDACSALSTSNNLGLPRCGTDLHAITGKSNGDPRIAKVIEDLLEKATKLENNFLRLDRSASILDLRLECQDLEKFSVINRFAKFHGRGQADNAEPSSSDATAITHKPCAQRYVTVVPMPRSLPDVLNGATELQEDGNEISSNMQRLLNLLD